MICYTVTLHGEIVGVYYHQSAASGKAWALEMQGHDASDIHIEIMGALNDNERQTEVS